MYLSIMIKDDEVLNELEIEQSLFSYINVHFPISGS